MIGRLLKRLFGTQNQRVLREIDPVVEKIKGFEPSVQALSDEALRAKTEGFRERLARGETEDDLLPEAFAVVREAGKRVLNMRHYDVQMVGGTVLHRGMIAEMITGEGKTLVATLPVYLNALSGEGVHVVTVNDYLARRDREWMGPLYEFLGLSVGVIQHDMHPSDRQYAYSCDITYGTNNEYGFDYLRDNMVVDVRHRVQRKLHFAIIDEVDSILIDEARTPLIISGPTEESTDKYYQLEKFSRRLKTKKITEGQMIDAKNEGVDYEAGVDALVDEKHRNVWFTEEGENKFESHFEVTPEDPRYIDFKHHRDQAIKAKELFQRDTDYVVKDGQVIIVDEFTGRLMPGRRFSDGLHQALEAKEGVKIERENQTLATVTFQNYFRMYDKLAGMTGTAVTEAVEFEKTYKLPVVVIPTNAILKRKNLPDVIYKTERERFSAVADEVLREHKKGRPVLVGTVSISKSEALSAILDRRGVPHSVLNAKYHEKEAEIISRAGQPSAITISTNMAGRGTDIVLGEGVAEKGGLHVVGTERHESRRIDNQLRGRCGRQGDPGTSQFFLSLEDDLMRLFGGDKLYAMMDRLGMEEGQDIQHPLVTRAIETAQKRVEGRNFEIRKHLLEYDDVMNRQREIIYEERRKILEGSEIKEHVLEICEETVEGMILNYLEDNVHYDEGAETSFWTQLKNKVGIDFGELAEKGYGGEKLLDEIMAILKRVYDEKEQRIGGEVMLLMQRSILIQMIDSKWKEHLHNLDALREGINLRAYGQRNPLVEYKHEAFDLFDIMTDAIKQEAVEFIFKVEVRPDSDMLRPVMSMPQDFVHPPHEVMPSQREEHHDVSSALNAADSRMIPQGEVPPQGKTKPMMRESKKVGRNDPCTCGSGKKYKKCCGINE